MSHRPAGKVYLHYSPHILDPSTKRNLITFLSQLRDVFLFSCIGNQADSTDLDCSNAKGTIFPVHAQKLYRGSNGTDPPVFNFRTRWQ